MHFNWDFFAGWCAALVLPRLVRWLWAAYWRLIARWADRLVAFIAEPLP